MSSRGTPSPPPPAPTPREGYVAGVAAERGHHSPGVSLHAFHQPVVPSAPRRIQRRVEGALPGETGRSAGEVAREPVFPLGRCPLTWNSVSPQPIWLTLGREPP